MYTLTELLKQFSSPAPRYNVYPIVSKWLNDISLREWLQSCTNSLELKDSTSSIYLHIPFCESLCSYCACNTYITSNHAIEEIYIETLVKELELYLEFLPKLKTTPVVQIYIGGGTPNFLSPKNLSYLLDIFYKKLNISYEHVESTIEIDPRHLSWEHAKVLSDYKFQRVRIGVEDIESNVQKIINRNLDFRKLSETCEMIEKLGIPNIDFDFIYGLPYQEIEPTIFNLNKVLALKPKRVAYYGYLHAPKIFTNQKIFNETKIPEREKRIDLLTRGREAILQSSYKELGIDYYVSEKDSLWLALEKKTLSRNCTGYLPIKTQLNLGFGVSAISETHEYYHQNEKILELYQKNISSNLLSSTKGHQLSKEDLEIKRIIQNLCNRREIVLNQVLINTCKEKEELQMLIEKKYISIEGNQLKVLDEGVLFLRHICLLFDNV